ncbi:MAG: hypothetical protein P8189_31190 [Anaerolineae bacterium]|jgi:hypothetical protein
MAILVLTGKETQILRRLASLLLLLCPFVLSGCVPVLVVREITYRPSPSDPYRLWGAYITDSGLLLLCGRVDNGRESMEQVERVYNLELRLEGTLDPPRSDAIQVVQIDEHPSLEMIKGYLSDLCQFDEKRATKKPEETGWTEIYMNNWDEGFVKIYPSDIKAGRLPAPPAEPRVVLYEVYDSDPPEYLLMGRLRKGGSEQRVLLVLGSEHIEAMW